MGSTNSTVPLPPVLPVEDLCQGNVLTIQKMQQSLCERSYAILSLKKGSQHSAIHQAENRMQQFFREKSPQEKSNLDSEYENLGYVLGSTREFLKWRMPDIPWLLEQSDVLTQQEAEDICQTMENIGWKCMTGLLGQHNPHGLKDAELQDLQQCVHERASISSIHYFPAERSEVTERSTASVPDKHFEVCGEHQDTGIFTIVVTSSVPGLEVYDTHLQKWRCLEEEIQGLRSGSEDILVVMMGHKAPLWFGENYHPTIHRVVIPEGKERPSLLYFMDTAKV